MNNLYVYNHYVIMESYYTSWPISSVLILMFAVIVIEHIPDYLKISINKDLTIILSLPIYYVIL